MNFLWSGSQNRSRAKVSLIQCCQAYEDGGINLINLQDALVSLMVKWIVKAIEPSKSNLHHLLRHRLSHFQPHANGRWSPSLDYFTLPQLQTHRGSKVWNRVGDSWKKLKHEIAQIRPTTPEALGVESFWWSSFIPLIGPGFSKARAAQLHRKGLKKVRDALAGDKIISAPEATTKFGLLED